MHKYGIDNVRGGSFCQIVFSVETRKFIQQILRGNHDECYYCGSKDHFAKNCTVDVHNTELKKFVNYCQNLVAGHNRFVLYLLDSIENNYHYFSDDRRQNGIHQFCKYGYDQFGKALTRKGCNC